MLELDFVMRERGLGGGGGGRGGVISLSVTRR